MYVQNLKSFKKRNQSFYQFRALLSDGSAVELEEDTIVKFRIKTGDEFSDQKWETILNFNFEMLGYRQTLRLLAIRPRSRYELKTRLLKEKYPEDMAERIVQKTYDQGLLDDVDFARRFAKARLKKKSMGEKALRFELQKKGIDRILIDQTVRAIFSDRDTEKEALILAEKKIKRIKDADPAKRFQKLTAFLAGRGFEMDICLKIAKKLSKS